MNLELIGTAAGILTTLAFVPQVLRTWRSRSAEDLSWGMLAMFNTGVALWVLYGVGKGAPSIIWANTVTLALALLLAALKAVR
ncbi:MAG: SemiSWEET family sugar transporter [Vicinamibacterales bacterium]